MIEGIKREKLYGKRVKSQNKKGKYVKSKISHNSNDIAIDATLRAAALRSGSNSKRKSNFVKNSNKTYKDSHILNDTNNSLNIKKEDLREKIRKNGSKLSMALVIDMSGSMISDEKLNRIKAILQKIIANVHVNRDKLAVIGFKGKNSELIIPNTKRPNSFLNKLENISVGGTTPMAAGLEKGLEVLKKDCNNEEYIPMLMVLSDGVTNVGIAKSNSNLANTSLKNSNISHNINNMNLGAVKGHDNKKLMNTPIQDVLNIGEKIANYNIHTVIVNFEKEKNKGRSVNRELAFVTGGRFYDLEQLGTILIEDSFKEEDVDMDSITFGSFKSDLSDMVLDNILDYERENI